MLPPHFYSLPTFRLLAIVLHYAKNPQYYYFGCSHYLLQCFTILKNPFIFTSILTCSGDLNVLCGSQVQIGVSLLGELTFTFLIKETYWYLILSASVCLKSFYFSIFENYFTVYRFWGMRGFFPFQNLKQTWPARPLMRLRLSFLLPFLCL